MPADFYLLEETLAIIKAIEKNLELHKLDPARHLNLSDAETRKHVQALIENLDALLAAEERDPRLLKLVTEVKGLREFLVLLQKALAGSPAYQSWLKRQKGMQTPQHVNTAIDRIVGALENWTELAEEKVHAHQRGPAKNQYLENLPTPTDPDAFYIMIKELSPLQTKYLHPFDPKQLESQQKRPTEDLLRQDPTDPIAGYRVWEPGDSTTFPGSGIRLVGGHHRTFELYRRYLQGEVSGDTLLLARKRYRP
jgi:hypothetical protein